MKSAEIISLPQAPPQYQMGDQQIMRRSVEQYCSDLRSDIEGTRYSTEGDATSAMRRHQFLLMGAS